MFLMLLFGIVGVLVKKWAPKEKSIIGKYVYQELVFSTFLRVASIYQFNLIYNGIRYLMMIHEDIPFI